MTWKIDSKGVVAPQLLGNARQLGDLALEEAHVLASVQSNLTSRGMYTPDGFEGTKKFFDAERKRYAEARQADKSASRSRSNLTNTW